MKRSGPLLLAALLLAACDPSQSGRPKAERPPKSPTPAISSVSPAQDALVDELPRRCEPWHEVPAGPEVTFSVRGRLFSLDPATGGVRCIQRAGSFRLEWGARGDRLLMTDPSAVAYGDGFRRRLPGDSREETWSRPIGTSVVSITHDFERLLKEEVSTGRVTDISFLDQHLDVAYHPAGTHIAVAGEKGGHPGLFLATNEGSEVQRIVRGEDAERIDELAFSQDGRRLYFRAVHGDRIDLHWVRIASGQETADTERALQADVLRTIYSGDKAPDYAVSPFGWRPRILFGPCAPGESRIRIGGGESELDPGLGAVDPIGWLRDDTALLIAYRARCDDFGEGDLYSWKDGEATLLVEDVDAAAVRARLPKAPDPPAPAQGVVAA